MSFPLISRGSEKSQVVDWSRLIPGGTSAFHAGEKKRARPARPLATERVSEIATEAIARVTGNALVLLLPGPLQGEMAGIWLRSIAADFALVALNWLLIGALQVPLRVLFPHVRLFAYAAGAPVSLLGIALLHAGLITLLVYAEQLHTSDHDLRGQARMIGKSVVWATTLLCFAYGLQGAPWATSGLFCGAGLLHFGALWTWRWQGARQGSGAQPWGRRKVLIVGAGSAGRRVASHVEGHPDEGRTVCGFLDDNRALSNKVIGRVSDLARLARTEFVDGVILTAQHDRDLTLQVLHEAQRLRLMLTSHLDDGEFARLIYEKIGNLIGPAFTASLARAVEAGDATRIGREPLNLFWFAHHAVLMATLARLPSVPCLAYGNSADLERQLCEFILRGIGLNETAIASHLDRELSPAPGQKADAEGA